MGMESKEAVYPSGSADPEMNVDAPPPPPAPPLPPIREDKIIGKPSKFWLKIKDAPNGGLFEGHLSLPPGPDPNLPMLGPYFVYGSLMDAPMLKDVLSLDHTPTLRPAQIVGYHRRSWGQYPALVDGEPGQPVYGKVYDVTTHAHASRLAEYETSNYRVAPVLIFYTDGVEPHRADGWAFKYCGRPNDLSDEVFDLEKWLRQVGRLPKETSTGGAHMQGDMTGGVGGS